MKKVKYILGFIMLGFGYSCTDFVDPAIPYASFETGVYLRTISRTDNIDFFQINSSSFNLEIEAVDEQNGNLVQEVDVYVSRRRANTETPEEKIATIPRSAFATSSASKYLRATYTTTIPAALTAMGLTAADINGGDFFQFRLDLLDTKGRRWTNTNLSGDISGGAYYRSPFFYRLPVVCPSDLGGTFNYSSSNMSSPFGSCPGTITGTVTLTPLSAGSPSYIVSDATFGFWGCYGDTFVVGDIETGPVRLNDACGGLSFVGTDKYGDTYTFNFISNNGTELVFKWVNASNEEGTVTLTANAGKPWPPDLR